MGDHINTTCCKRHAVELLNASPDDLDRVRELLVRHSKAWGGTAYTNALAMTDLERVKSWLSHGDEVEQELAADVVAHLKEDAKAWRGAMEYRKQLQAQRDTLLAALTEIGRYAPPDGGWAARAQVEGEK